MSKKNQNEIYLKLDERSIIDGNRLRADEDYLGAVIEKVASVSETGVDDLQDWLAEGDWTGVETIASVASEWDELNNQEL